MVEVKVMAPSVASPFCVAVHRHVGVQVHRTGEPMMLPLLLV